MTMLSFGFAKAVLLVLSLGAGIGIAFAVLRNDSCIPTKVLSQDSTAVEDASSPPPVHHGLSLPKSGGDLPSTRLSYAVATGEGERGEQPLSTPLPAVEVSVATPNPIRFTHPPQSSEYSEPRLMEPGAFYAQATCEDMHPTWTRKPEPVTTRVINSFLYNGEADLLEIKLYELFDVMDLFVVVESKFDFRGRPKQLYFDSSDRRWARYLSKIEHYLVEFDTNRAKREQWYAEVRSREELNGHLHQLVKQGDIVIAGDLDELPRREVIRLLKNCEIPREQKPLRLWMPHLYFHLGCLVPNELWAVLVNWADEDNQKLFTNRDAHNGRFNSKFGIADGGWHMSWMFKTIAQYQHKLSTFSHSELDNAFYKDPVRIREIVCNDLHLFDKRKRCQSRYTNHSNELPHFLLDHPTAMLYLRPGRCKLEPLT